MAMQICSQCKKYRVSSGRKLCDTCTRYQTHSSGIDSHRKAVLQQREALLREGNEVWEAEIKKLKPHDNHGCFWRFMSIYGENRNAHLARRPGRGTAFVHDRPFPKGLWQCPDCGVWWYPEGWNSGAAMIAAPVVQLMRFFVALAILTTPGGGPVKRETIIVVGILHWGSFGALAFLGSVFGTA